MAAPANDLFANAQQLWVGGVVNGTTVGATSEPGEKDLPFNISGPPLNASVWYQWMADTTGSVTLTLTNTSGSHAIAVYVGNGLDPDSIATLTSATAAVTSGSSLTWTAQAGTVYYFRVVGYYGTAPEAFALTYPPGRDPRTIAAPGTDDLPSLLSVVRGTATSDLLEAVGFAPDSERTIVNFDILADDEHTGTVYKQRTLMVRNSDGSPSFSCERWVRLRFSPPFGAITKLRFWVDNYDPNANWELRWGTSDEYQKPTTSASQIATHSVPTTDPDMSNLGVDMVTGGVVTYSPWIVLQATWLGSQPGTIQPTPLNWSFGWAEA